MQIMYKQKTQKINLIDVNILDESKFETNLKWRKILKSSVIVDFLKQLKRLYDSFLIFKFLKISRDSRMISKRLQKMLFDVELFFQERNLLIEMLYRRKIALIWNFNKIDKIWVEIMKDQKIRIVSHKAWQAFNFPISKVLKFIIIKMFQERIDIDLFKFNFDLYKNLWFLIDKKIKNKYRMINAIMNMNEMIIRDVNLPFNVEKFSKEFVNMLITSLIDFFSDYDQITFVEKCRNLTIFMISFKLLKIIKFSQKIINSIV